MTGASPPVDIVVPVYNAPDDLRRCVDSVLACTSGSFALVLIDDASPDPRIAAYFNELAHRNDRRIVLLRNERNEGFTATANRGMMRSRADIVLLNSDTIVTRGWLDALVRCADSDRRIATVTPFSNNAEICSFPRFCENNVWDGDDPERIRKALADAAVPTYPDLPTGVGFCMFVRREAIDAVGAFDIAFGAGYGEENDFCLRAACAGYRNVLADDAFVVHTGGRSFAGRKDDLGARNLTLLERLHPHYTAMVRDYIAADPLRPLRQAAQSRLDLDMPARRVLHVVHDRGGGTEAYVRTLIDASRDGWQHYLAVAVGDRWQVEAHADDGERPRTFGFTRRDDESWPAFLGGIVATFDIALVHVHHLSGCRDGALAALSSLGVPYGITIHDLWLACPTVTLTRADDHYCGGVTDAEACTRCLAAFPSLRDVDIASWRNAHAELLAAFAFLIAPSRWAADMLARYFPQTRGRVEVIPHAMPGRPLATSKAVTAVLLPRDDVPTVAVVGAIGPDKGARRIDRLAQRVRERGERLRFVVIGYLDVQHTAWQSDDGVLTVHGPYVPTDLRVLFGHYRVEFVLYPSEGPESFSYTLSESWSAGMPALVPPIGALAERVAQTQAGWVMTDDEWRDDDRMLDRMLALVSPAQLAVRDRAKERASTTEHPTPRAMSEATLSLYSKALATPVVASRQSRFCNARIRDAMDYRPWSPPPIAPSVDAARDEAPRDDARRGVWQRVALRALAMRRTPMGRFLYRVTPEPVIDALKSRLHG